MLQIPKKRIDVGQVGNASTGDILFDGGEKINNGLDALYNTFGDYRMFAANNGVDNQVLHGTGYYQKHARTYYASNPVDLGSLHDIDTLAGSLSIILPKGKAGEGIYCINSNGSISTNTPLTIRPQAGDTIEGYPSDAVITAPYSRIVVWCKSVEAGRSTWKIGIQSMFEVHTVPVDKTVNLTTAPTNILIAGKSEFNTIKLMISAMSPDGATLKSSETLIMVDQKTNDVLSTEYAILKNTDSELYKLRYFVGVGDMLYLEASAVSGNVRFAVKAIETIKIGAAV